MPEIRADGVAVYVYRRVTGGLVELLQVHRSTSTGEYQKSWQTVYGGVEKGETAVATAIRELREETRLEPVKMWQVEYLESFYFMPHDYVLVMPVFAVEVEAGAAITLNDEHDAFRWVPEAHVGVSFMWRTQREAIAFMLEQLRRPGMAEGFLRIK
jgi:dATP pyrophosphohydrolase